MKVFALRLKPNQDLKESLKNFVVEHDIKAGFVLTAIGSLKQATLRFANQNISTVLTDKFEIISPLFLCITSIEFVSRRSRTARRPPKL